MTCCGQKRQAWRERTLPRVQAAPPPLPTPQNPVVLRHLGASSLVVKGTATAHVYLFAGRDSSLPVDERDVAELIAMGVFEVVAS